MRRLAEAYPAGEACGVCADNLKYYQAQQRGGTTTIVIRSVHFPPALDHYLAQRAQQERKSMRQLMAEILAKELCPLSSVRQA